MKAIKMSYTPAFHSKGKKGDSDLKHALYWKKNTFKDHEEFDFSL